MSADCPGCWPTPKLPITRAPRATGVHTGTLYVGHTATITHVDDGTKRIDLPEPLTIERGRYKVTIEADDTVTIERTPDA